jgi:hypothetical protein
MADEEIEGKGFVIKDRRRFTEEGEPKEETGPEEQAEELASSTQEEAEDRAKEEAEDREEVEEKVTEEMPFPEINFSTFIFSLNTSALLHLGEIPDPATGRQQEDLAMAKQTIDLIAMLQEKTQGNLALDEENLVKHILYDLRLRYVQKAK